MPRSVLGPKEHFLEKYGLYGRMLFKIAMVHVGNKSDAEEAVQEAFIKLIYKAPIFNDLEHEKAWLIRVVTNICKNMISSLWSKRVIRVENIEIYCETVNDRQLLHTLVQLPFKYKAVIHLFYYEGYTVKEIAGILKIRESSVKMRLLRGRKLLKLELEGEE